MGSHYFIRKQTLRHLSILSLISGILFVGCGGDGEVTRDATGGETSPAQTLEITGVDPCYAPLETQTVLTIQGSGFEEGSMVYFGSGEGSDFGVADDSVMSVDAVAYSSSEVLTTTITCHVEDQFAVAVENPDGSVAAVSDLFQCSNEEIVCETEAAPGDDGNFLDEIVAWLEDWVSSMPMVIGFQPHEVVGGDKVAIFGLNLEDRTLQATIAGCTDYQTVEREESMFPEFVAQFTVPDFDSCGTPGDALPLNVQILDADGEALTVHGEQFLELTYYIGPVVSVKEYEPTEGGVGEEVTLTGEKEGSTSAFVSLRDLDIKVRAVDSNGTVIVDPNGDLCEESPERTDSGGLFGGIHLSFDMPDFNRCGSLFEQLDVRIFLVDSEGEEVAIKYNGENVASLPFAYTVTMSGDEVGEILEGSIDVLKVLFPSEEVPPPVWVTDVRGAVKVIDQVSGEGETLGPILVTPVPGAVKVLGKELGEEEVTPILMTDAPGAVKVLNQETEEGEGRPVLITSVRGAEKVLDQETEEGRVFPVLIVDIAGAVKVLDQGSEGEENRTPVLITDFKGASHLLPQEPEPAEPVTPVLITGFEGAILVLGQESAGGKVVPVLITDFDGAVTVFEQGPEGSGVISVLITDFDGVKLVLR